MYSKAKVAGHPIHPMLVAFPVASYTGTLVAFAVYAANGHQFWLNLAIALNVVGVCGAVLAALPGLADWAFGIPLRSEAKKAGLVHAGLNVAALGLFLAAVVSYEGYWNGPSTSATLGLVLSAIGVVLTVSAGFFGWMLVQDYHVGIRLTPEQELAEPTVQHTQPSVPGSRHAV
ncbi:MAG: DUF2231 domain-containing protein [Trebonia sp.]